MKATGFSIKEGMSWQLSNRFEFSVGERIGAAVPPRTAAPFLCLNGKGDGVSHRVMMSSLVQAGRLQRAAP